MSAPVTPLLTETQHAVLSAIRDHFTVHGYPPAVRDVAGVVGLSPSTVVYHLGRLEELGWIRRAPGRARGLVVLNPDDGTDS